MRIKLTENKKIINVFPYIFSLNHIIAFQPRSHVIFKQLTLNFRAINVKDIENKLKLFVSCSNVIDS